MKDSMDHSGMFCLITPKDRRVYRGRNVTKEGKPGSPLELYSSQEFLSLRPTEVRWDSLNPRIDG